MDPSVASPRINQYERGKHLPDPLTLQRLGRVLDRPLAFFHTADDEMAEIIFAFHMASADERKKLLALARRTLTRAAKAAAGSA